MIFCVENVTGEDFSFDAEGLAREVAQRVLEDADCPFEAQVHLLIVGAEEIRRLNDAHRGRDAVTDVLSFPGLEFEAPGVFSMPEEALSINLDPESGAYWLGDIVICKEAVGEQAARYGHSERRELAFLVAHAMLHLTGYDHETEEEEEVMTGKQEEILSALGITRDA